MRQPWNIAVPSCVIPGTVAENARFLNGKVTEAGLCLFEAQSCLEYGVADVPSSLKELDLAWHAHLPVDLPWEAGGGAAAAMALAVMGKVGFLAPRLAVLHPPLNRGCAPSARADLLLAFAAAWRRHCAVPVLLENIDACSLLDLPPAALEPFGLCLDVGHMLAYGQEELLERPELLERVRLLHWSAPGAGDQHLPLRALTPEQMPLAQKAAQRVPSDAVHMIEVFHWAGVEASLPILSTLRGQAWH